MWLGRLQVCHCLHLPRGMNGGLDQPTAIPWSYKMEWDNIVNRVPICEAICMQNECLVQLEWITVRMDKKDDRFVFEE